MMRCLCLFTAILSSLSFPLVLSAEDGLTTGEPVTLHYHSEVDDTEQPYTVYIPESLSGPGPWPLAVMLHGTSTHHDSYLIQGKYNGDKLMAAAEKHRTIILCPEGRGATEWWGIAENDVFAALHHFRTRVPVDSSRIWLTGHSMGGGGTAYLALRYPDVFAAAAPMVGTPHRPLAENARHTPFYFLVGSEEYAPRLLAIGDLATRMESFGFQPRFDLIPGADHSSFVPEAWEKVLAWFQDKHRVHNPDFITHNATFPQYGRAWWISIDAMETPGSMGRLEARRLTPASVRFTTSGLRQFRLFPEEAALDLDYELLLEVDGQHLSLRDVRPDQQVTFTRTSPDAPWQVRMEPLHIPVRGAYRENRVATATERFAYEPSTTYNLALWTADAMRDATGADIVLKPMNAYRGVPIESGPVTTDDLIQCVRPGYSPLVRIELTGAVIEELLEANAAPGANLLYVSGMHYVVDTTQPPRQRIQSTDLDPDRTYTVCVRENNLLRRHIRFTDENFPDDLETLPLYNHDAYYRYALKQGTLNIEDPDRIRRR